MAHPNEDRIRQGFEAFSKGDMEAVGQLFADDVAWHVPGRNPIAGDYRGKDEVFRFFATLMERTGGSLSIEVHDVLANDEHAVALITTRGHSGEKTLDANGVQVFHVREGRVTESWLHPGDAYAADEFWS